MKQTMHLKDMRAVSGKCAHCGEQVIKGDRCLVYINPKAEVPIKMLVHQHCAEAFFGPAGPTGGVQ